MERNDVSQALGTGSIAPEHVGRGRLPATGYLPHAAAVDPALQREVETLLYRQAAMLDAKAWSEWCGLFSDHGIYWMPATPDQTDWEGQPSIFAEDGLLREVRMGRLQHPNAWSQAASWATNHLVGNVMIESV